ncbi:hypothetical protein SUGI_0750060 [Cryptomeria japonica]|nr:hypothetical protein SUGI_0750060 [Cryptomeria japonica]
MSITSSTSKTRRSGRDHNRGIHTPTNNTSNRSTPNNNALSSGETPDPAPKGGGGRLEPTTFVPGERPTSGTTAPRGHT